MNCDDARQIVLSSLNELVPAERVREMENHLLNCDACREFAYSQHLLDLRLAAAMPAVSLSPRFRTSMMRRIYRDSTTVWSDFLPDIAHLVGCAFALALLVFLLPFPPGRVIFIVTIFTGTTYLLQGALRSPTDGFEEGV